MELSLIIACYNEAEHLEKSFQVLIQYLKKNIRSYEIIIVEDKSTDNTLAIIKKLRTIYSDEPIILLCHKNNEGRGKSIYDGIRLARGTYVGYLDIDLEISQRYISDALHRLSKYDVVVGNRRYEFLPKTVHRYIASKGYVWLVKALLKLPVSDTESGFKFFNRRKIIPILKKATNPGWFWDTEIIAYSFWSNLKICDIPVVYKRRNDKKSTVHTLTDSVSYFVNLLHLVKDHYLSK